MICKMGCCENGDNTYNVPDTQPDTKGGEEDPSV